MVRPLRPMGVELSTAAWYGDLPLRLDRPAGWQMTVHWPDPPPALSDDQIAAALRAPAGQPPLTTLAAQRRRVAIVVDDLTRPTPADVILPHLVRALLAARVDTASIGIVVATGSHGRSRAEAARKVGADIARRFAVSFHDDLHGCVRLGKTSFGSPVSVNRRVAEADLVIGVGGVYPQYTVGYGGGTKIILGVLGRRSIERLHFRHAGSGGRYDRDSDFRADVAEMAAMAGLEVVVGAMVDARRRLCWIRSGDPAAWFDEACADAQRWFTAQGPGDADVVIANAYPMDLSATFVRSKGIVPLTHARPGASRILIGAASEGIGHHGLFPLAGGRGQALISMARTARNRPLSEVVGLAWRRLATVPTALRRRPPSTESGSGLLPVHFYPTATAEPFPARLGDLRPEPAWERILERVTEEQGGREHLRAVLYPCAPLQIVEG